MPLSLETAQALAIGSFNPHIISPEWLVKNKVCEDAEVEIRFMPLSQGLAFSFKDVQWQIDSRLLMVASRKENCGNLVAAVIRLLPHTPVRQVGNNFHYAASRDDWNQSSLPMLGSARDGGLGDFGRLEQTRWGCVLRKDEVRVEVTVAQDEPGMAVLFNFHRETKSAEDACKAAESFESDRQRSRDILGRLAGQEVAT
jgi:hypothetical protein